MTGGNCLYESIADRYYKDKSLYKIIKRKLFEGYAKLDSKTKNQLLKKLNLKNDKAFYDKFYPDGSHGTDYNCIILSRELNINIAVYVVEERIYTIYYKDKEPINSNNIDRRLIKDYNDYIIIKYYNHHYS